MTQRDLEFRVKNRGNFVSVRFIRISQSKIWCRKGQRAYGDIKRDSNFLSVILGPCSMSRGYRMLAS